MNINQLHQQIAQVVNQALTSGEVPPQMVIMVLENLKLEVFHRMKEVESQSKIIPIGKINLNGDGR